MNYIVNRIIRKNKFRDAKSMSFLKNYCEKLFAILLI